MGTGCKTTTMRAARTKRSVEAFFLLCTVALSVGCHHVQPYVKSDWGLFKSVYVGMSQDQVSHLLGHTAYRQTNRGGTISLNYGGVPDPVYIGSPMHDCTIRITLSNNVVIAKDFFGSKPDWVLFKFVQAGMNQHNVGFELGPALSEVRGPSYYKAYYGRPIRAKSAKALSSMTIVVSYSTNDAVKSIRAYGTNTDIGLLHELIIYYYDKTRQDVEPLIGPSLTEVRVASGYDAYYKGKPVHCKPGVRSPTTIQITFSLDGIVQSKEFFGKQE
jgi:hypothetical protein